MIRTSRKIILPLVGEFVVALAMLALLILSFAPVTPANSILSSASASQTRALPASWCGAPLSGDENAHPGACHACRAHAAQIPAAPCNAEPAFAGPIDAPFVAAPVGGVQRPSEFSNGTRAPPVAV